MRGCLSAETRFDRVGYALIGFGQIAAQRLAREGFGLDRSRFAPLAEARLVGATDVNPARREAVELLGLKWYPDAEAIWGDPGVDAVMVASNNASHFALAEAALLRGRHVLVEKPMATNSRDAKRLCWLAAERRLSLAVNHMMTENVFNQAARGICVGGGLGEIKDAVFHMEFLYGSTPEESTSWRCARREEMGGPIGDVGSHCLYMAEFLLNDRIAAVACVYYPKTMSTVVEDGAHIRYRLRGGLTGSIRVAFCEPRGSLPATLDNLGYEIYGTAGVLRGRATLFQLSGHDGEPVQQQLIHETADRCEEVSVPPPVNIYQAVIRRHAHSVLEGEPLGGWDGQRNVRLVEWCHASAQSGGEWREVKDDRQ
ncbi:MAG: Gfo/Idh/MocA family oxidoreductase [Candidatus Marinimicrobia bacterium]|nr:Gfo/Idh/MocA family oxidoreductase [Candidatus Neomarinimicrobiota bacterium]